jgi:protein ImuB
VRRLPRAGLRQRTEDALAQALDAAYGLAPEHFRWVRAPLAFSGRAEPEQHIEHAHALLFVAQRLVEQLCGWLAAHRQAATRAKLVLVHEQGAQAIAPTVIVIALRLPAWHPEHFLLVLAEHLHNLELAAPVVAVTLAATHIQGMAPATLDLFPDPGSQPAHRQRLIERLAARLGRANLRQPDPIADHRPEIANHWVPIDQATPATMRVTGAERPFWLLAHPQALPTKGLRPFYRSPLTIVSGPERIEDGWWSGMVARDYFVARSPEGVRYWIFRERGNSGDKDSSGWFLHGLFG